MAVVAQAVPTAGEGPAPVRPAAQIRSDWLRQDEVRGVAVFSNLGVRPEEDAMGACDGVRSGSFGFHTAREDRPWWQIDLGAATPLDEVMIYNRCDGSAERAAHLRILVSGDGTEWTEVYRHDGTVFLGHIDDRPLSVKLDGVRARYLRVQLPETNTCLHLDEVEVYPATSHRNVALRKPATQSSVSRWSTRADPVITHPPRYATEQIVRRGLKLADRLEALGVDVSEPRETLARIARQGDRPATGVSEGGRRARYFEARRAVRRLALANPLLDFDDLLFVKRVPAQFTTSPTSRTYTHMSDQYYGWFSRPGGGLYVLEDFRSDRPRLRCLTGQLPPGNIIRPDLSYDGRRVLFAYARYYEQVHGIRDKLDKSAIPEDAFYQLYEVNLDGTGLRRLTRGKYDDFDGRYLPGGGIVFLSTRRGPWVQCRAATDRASGDGQNPDIYVRCGGDAYRPVAVYTLHRIDEDGSHLRSLSPFAMFEWHPAVASDGRILYARWDYVDREAMPYMSLWSMLADGTAARSVFGNYTVNPHCMFEPRQVPGSSKIVFTASAHHANTAGSLVLLDPRKASDGPAAMTRLTPEVPFPEIEAWPTTYFANPYPLSEDFYLVAWSDKPLTNPGDPAGAAALGIYLLDAFGNLELLYRDPEICSMYPLPVRPRRSPPQVAGGRPPAAVDEGQLAIVNLYQGLEEAPPGSIRHLRLVGIPGKDHPVMNAPVMGVTGHDPGKFVLGTVPVEEDGSAYFRVPSGVPFFVQALDERGMAVQSMRSAVTLQPGERRTCIGCHEPRNTAPPNRPPAALRRPPSTIRPGPPGSWPLDYTRLVQPVWDRRCTSCHRPGGDAQQWDLTAGHSYDVLVNYGRPSLRSHVITRHRAGRSVAGACAAHGNALVHLLDAGHYAVRLTPHDWERVVTWMDTYGQRRGAFSDQQEDRLRQLRSRLTALLSP